MRTGSKMNDIDKRTKHMRRRILASVCAVAIALLQCAVIVTIGTEDAYAVSDLTVNVECDDGISNKDYSKAQLDPKEPFGDGKVGIRVKDIFKKTGINGEYKDISDGLDPNDFWCPDDEKFYSPDGSDKVNKQAIRFIMKDGYTPVTKIDLEGYPTSGTVGDPPIKMSDCVKYEIESFFKNDKDKYISAVDLNWSVEGSSATIDNQGNVTITGEGAFKVNVSGTHGEGTIEGDTANITGQTKAPEKKDIKNTTITPPKNVEYNGKAQKPKPTIKDGSKTLKENVDYTLKYSNNKNVGTATVTINGTGNYKGTTSTTFKITKKSTTKKTSKTTKYKPATGSYRTYATRHTLSGGATTSTGTTVPNVTYAPDRTITVKEVFLGQQIQDEPAEEPTPADMMDAASDDMMDDANDDWAEDESVDLDFGPMAGSAAVATAACGAGVVGRIRRFKVDTAAKAVSQITNSKGK